MNLAYDSKWARETQQAAVIAASSGGVDRRGIDAVFPAQYEIEHIRAYQYKNTSSSSRTDNEDFSIDGNVIAFKTGDYYQIQTGDGVTTIVEGNGNDVTKFPYTLADGNYKVINLTTGQRYETQVSEFK